MKTTIIRILKLAALLLPIVLFVLISQYFVFSHTDHNTNRFSDFYDEPEDSLDVVYLGASEMFVDISPVYAYEIYGYTSYPYAQDANPGNLYLSQLKEVLAHQSPQLILVEINAFIYGHDGMLTKDARLRAYTENIPWSINKIRTIMEFDCKDKLSCFIPFIKYHGDWNNPYVLETRYYNKTTPYNSPSMLKGLSTRCAVDPTPGLEIDKVHEEELAPITKLEEQYLREFVQFCKDNNLNVVFLRCPHKVVDNSAHETLKRTNYAGTIIEEYGFDFINLEKLNAETGLDELTDFYDQGHLNIYGQRKLTRYLGNLIVNKYGVTPRQQTPENEAQWEKSIAYMNACYDLIDQNIKNGIDGQIAETPELLELLENHMS